MSEARTIETTLGDLGALLEKTGQCRKGYWTPRERIFHICKLKVGHAEKHVDGYGRWTENPAEEIDL